MTKKITSLLLIISCILSCFTIYAEEQGGYNAQKDAQILYDLGLFKGTDNGFELERESTRTEAIVMIIRLLGREGVSKTLNHSHPFSDVAQWADYYIGYAYKMNISNGISKSEFGANSLITREQFLTLVLRAMNYSDKDGANKDFSWDNPNALADKIGLSANLTDSDSFTRAQMVTICKNALTSLTKGGQTRLYQVLVNSKVFTRMKFLEISGYNEEYVPTASICKIKDDKKGVYTITIDDGDVAQGTKLLEFCKKYNLKSTAMLIANKNNSAWNDLIKDGYIDIGCHGYTHTKLLGLDKDTYIYETVDAIEALRSTFPEQNIITYATPYTGDLGDRDGKVYEAIYANRSANDNYFTTVYPKGSVFYNLPSKLIKSDDTAESLNADIDTLCSNGGWLIQLWHGIIEGTGYAPTEEVTDAHFAYVSSKADSIWIASFTEAVAYIRERDTAKLEVSGNEKEVSITITDEMDDSLFDEPLSVKLEIPYGAKNIVADSDEGKQTLTPTEDGYVYVDVVPNGKAVKVTF